MADEQPSVQYVQIDDTPDEHRTVFGAIQACGWGPWHMVRSLTCRTLADSIVVHSGQAPMVDAFKTAGRWLGDRVMCLDPHGGAGDQARQWGVTCERGRWRVIYQADLAARRGEIKVAIADEPDRTAAAIRRLRGAHGYQYPQLTGELADDVCALLDAFELQAKDLNYKTQECEGLKRSCDNWIDQLRAARSGEATLERELAEAKRATADAERKVGAVAVEAVLSLAEMRARLDATQAELRAAIETIDSIAPRPWEASVDPDDGPFDDLDEEEMDDCPWVVTDSNDDPVDRTWGPKEPSNGAWARGWVETVNALGSTLPREEKIDE